MNMNDIADKILDHYEKYLGKYIGADRFEDSDFKIQLLGYDKVFENCLTFATFGLSKYSAATGERCELIMAADDDLDKCADILVKSVYCMLQNNIRIGAGFLLGGIDDIAKGFSEKHGKSELYITEAGILPEEFAYADCGCSFYMAFLISEKEADYIRQNGCDAFEELLAESEADVIDINRPSIV